MSAPTQQPGATMECATCETDVPAGRFCGLCGDHLTEERRTGPKWLRMRAYGASSREHLLRPSIVSTLFPQLSHDSRVPMRVCFVVLLLALAVSAYFRLPGAMIATTALGFPLLFGIYIGETEQHNDIPNRTLLVTVASALVLGVGWVLLTGQVIARSNQIAIGAEFDVNTVLRDGVGIPLGGLLLMILPILLARLTRPLDLESMDGFALGTLAALTFTGAASITRMMPQFANGTVARARDIEGMFIEAGIRGLAVPITAAAIGGLVGTALWFKRPPSKAHQHPGYVRFALALFAVAVVGLFTVPRLIDTAVMPQLEQLGLHLTVAAIALLVLRIGVHLALLHEAHDEVQADRQMLCPECRQVVPDMAFCPNCGAANRGSSRASRSRRRSGQPSGDVAPSRQRNLLRWSLAIVMIASALVSLTVVLAKPKARYVCPPDCGRPSTGMPVTTNPRYTAPDGSFSVSYPAPGTAYDVELKDDGVVAQYVSGDTGSLQLFSQPANGRTPQQIATQLVDDNFPDARVHYEIPNTMVGYQPGYGVAADCWPQDADASYSRMRIVVMVAVKNDLALVAAAIGPFREFGPEYNSKPSAANIELALDMGKYVNSFSWRGDPPR